MTLCGCWMCFRWSPLRFTVRNVLCRRKGREKMHFCFFAPWYTVQRWAASLLIPLSHYFRTNNILALSKHKNKTSYLLLPSRLCHIKPMICMHAMQTLVWSFSANKWHRISRDKAQAQCLFPPVYFSNIHFLKAPFLFVFSSRSIIRGCSESHTYNCNVLLCLDKTLSYLNVNTVMSCYICSHS